MDIKLPDDINFALVSFTYFDTKFHKDFHFYVVIIHLLFFLNIIFIWDFIEFVFLLSKLNSYRFSWVTGTTNHAEISGIIILDFLATFSSANLSIAYSLFDKNFKSIDRMQEIEIKNLCMNSVNKNTEIRDYSILKTIAFNSAYI